MMPKVRLSNCLEAARAEKNFSQEQLASLAGITRQTIISIETGQYYPSTALTLLLAQRLGKRVDEIFFLEGAQNTISSDQKVRGDERTAFVFTAGAAWAFCFLTCALVFRKWVPLGAEDLITGCFCILFGVQVWYKTIVELMWVRIVIILVIVYTAIPLVSQIFMALMKLL